MLSTPVVDSEGWKQVTMEYNKLQECIVDLGETISTTLSDQREDLESSHNADLRKLSLEIDRLKLDKTKLEESIASNERANVLENERDWFKKECLHLDKVLEKTKDENKELRDQLQESQADRRWMKDQIEKVM